ncbi:MAG TPA: hypothetical protein VKZ60_14010 [Chloroflexota bacterium]|jgi:hypothetical protein|nr:hypothetical protein [Chloroflexota bacterium]
MSQTESGNPNLGAAAGASGLKSYTALQLFFLMRLSYLIRRRKEELASLDPSHWKYKLLNKSLYSTYCDCVAEGVGEEAKVLLGQQQAGEQN